MAPLDTALRMVAADLDAAGMHWALIGGAAVGIRSTPHFTKDLDFSVAGTGGAEDMMYAVLDLQPRGYAFTRSIRAGHPSRPSGVQLAREGSDVGVDLLFSVSGIEAEVAAAADRIEVASGLTVPVATVAHLIALKVLAGRSLDLVNLEYLIAVASPADLDAAREATGLITARGFSQGRDIAAELERFMAEMGPRRPGREASAPSTS